MKKVLASVVMLFVAITVNTQKNSDVVKIVEQTVSYESAEDIRNFLSDCGFDW